MKRVGTNKAQRLANKERLIKLMKNNELVEAVMNNKYFIINRNKAFSEVKRYMTKTQVTNDMLFNVLSRVKTKPMTEQQLINGFNDVDSDEWIMFKLDWAISYGKKDVTSKCWKEVQKQQDNETEYTYLIDLFRVEHETEDSEHSNEELIDEAIEVVEAMSERKAIKRIQFLSTLLESGRGEVLEQGATPEQFHSSYVKIQSFVENHKDEIHNYFLNKKIKEVEDELSVVNEFVAIIENRSRNLNEINKLMRANPELFDEYIFQSGAKWVVRLANDFREANQRDAYLLINYMYSHQELLIEHKQRLVNQLIEIKPKPIKKPNATGRGKVQVWLMGMSDDEFKELVSDTKLLIGQPFKDKWGKQKSEVNSVLKKLNRSSD